MTKTLIKSLSIRTFFWIVFWMAAACAIVCTGAYWAIRMAALKLTALPAGAPLADYDAALAEMASWVASAEQYYLPATIGFFLVLGLLLWSCIRVSLAMAARRETPSDMTGETRKSRPVETSEAATPEAVRQRLFLHLLASLQREGRLIDFLKEDLTGYADDQVGAAVRNIHENCKKALAKYVTLAPIVEPEEESEMTVAADFDPDAIRLVGNVAGDPPFRGVVRHRGWMARKIEVPTLSGARDPGIVAPAEIEL